MSGGPQLTEGCQSDCVLVREDTEATVDNQLVFIKQECLEDDDGLKKEHRAISTQQQPTENIEYQTESMKEKHFEDEWIAADKSEERPPVDEEVLPYRVHIKEEVMDNGYVGDDTTDMNAHASYAQDGSNKIVVSTKVFSEAQTGRRLHNTSTRKRKVSSENLPSNSASIEGQNQKDYFQVVCAEEVDTMDQYDEDGHIPGEMGYGEDMGQDGSNARQQMFEYQNYHHKSDSIPYGMRRRQRKKKRTSQSPSEDSQDTVYSEEEIERQSDQIKGKKKTPRKKQGPRRVYRLEDSQLEEEILQWMQEPENDFLWNSRRTEYRFPEKKKARFLEKEKSLNMEEGFLSKWFGGLRDWYTKLHKKAATNGTANFTERQQWVLHNLKFFNKLVAHRGQSVKNFTPVIAEQTVDLEAMEKAIAEQARKEALEEERALKEKKRLSPVRDDTELTNLRRRQKDFDDIIATIQTKLSEPETDVTAYAMYLKTTLMSLKRSKFKKARKAINRALEPFLDSSDEDSNEDSRHGLPSKRPR